jgi:hypothetical protein
VQAFERDGARAAGQADALGHASDRADLRVVAVVTRDEQHLLLVACVDGQGHIHVREDDDVVQRYEQERAQHITSQNRISP